jgi:hypothetical protein
MMQTVKPVALALLLVSTSAVITGVTGFVVPWTTKTPNAASVTNAFRRRHTSTAASAVTSLQAIKPEFALLFDCDGVILETEELHRLAYNHAFRHFDVTINGEPVEWSVSCADLLQLSVERILMQSECMLAAF